MRWYGLGQTSLRTQFWASYRQVQYVKVFVHIVYWVLVMDGQCGGSMIGTNTGIGIDKHGQTEVRTHQ